METLIVNGLTIEEFLGKVRQTVADTIKSETESSLKSDKVKYLTRKETAELLSISLPTLWQYTKRGIISAHRCGSRILYKEDEVESALSQIVPHNPGFSTHVQHAQNKEHE
ncbi:hypothetical protein ES705_25641 [subsurface metagenome]